MRLVVADSSPLNYLVWIEQVEILPALFERIFVPEVVHLIRLNEAVERLKGTSFRYPPDLLNALLARHSRQDKS